MRPLRVPDTANVILALHDEIRRSPEARYDHRLHGLLLVAQGFTAPHVAHMLGDSPRTVEYWVHRFETEGLAGLAEGYRTGRPTRVSDDQIEQIGQALRKRPEEVGMSGGLWDGKTLSAFIEERFGVKLGVRQCQRLFRQLDFRLRKPRPQLAHADPIVQAAHKKTTRDDDRPLFGPLGHGPSHERGDHRDSAGRRQYRLKCVHYGANLMVYLRKTELIERMAGYLAI